MNVLDTLREAERKAHEDYANAWRDPTTTDDERRHLRREWKLSVDTLLAECSMRAQLTRSPAEAGGVASP